MFVTDLFENDNKQVLVIYPGRFQPFHKGHAQVYNYLAKQYGANNVYICTSDKVEPPRSPFNFAEKVKMIALTGIDTSRVVQSTQPYRAMEIVGKYDQQNTILLFAVSEKDMAEDPRFSFKPKKDGSPSYFQPFKALSQCESAASHAYMITVPTFTFTVLGQPAQSATQIRAQYAQADEETRKMIINDLFGNYSDDVFAIMNNKLGGQVAEGHGGRSFKPDDRNLDPDVDDLDYVAGERTWGADRREVPAAGHDRLQTRQDWQQHQGKRVTKNGTLNKNVAKGLKTDIKAGLKQTDEDRITPKKPPRKGTLAWEIMQDRKKQDQDPEYQKFIASLGNKDHMYGTAKVQHPVTEVSTDTLKAYKDKAVASQQSNFKKREDAIASPGSDKKEIDQLNRKMHVRHDNIARAKNKISQQGVNEAYGLNKRVKIVGKPAPSAWIGKTGWVGEVRHGAYKGAPKTYTVDLDNGAGSIQLPSSALRLIKDEPTNEGMFDRFKKKEPTMQPVTPEQRELIKSVFRNSNADVKWGRKENDDYVLPLNVNATHGKGRIGFRNEDGVLKASVAYHRNASDAVSQTAMPVTHFDVTINSADDLAKLDKQLTEGWKGTVAGLAAAGAIGAAINGTPPTDGSITRKKVDWEPKVAVVQGKEYIKHALPSDSSKVQLTTDDNGNKIYAWVEKSGMRPQYTYYWYAPVNKANESKSHNNRKYISESAKVRSFTYKQGITKYEVLNSKGVTVKTGFTDKKSARDWMHDNYGDL